MADVLNEGKGDFDAGSTRLMQYAFGENSVRLLIFPGGRLTLVFTG